MPVTRFFAQTPEVVNLDRENAEAPDAAAAWILVQEGEDSPSHRVIDYIPEYCSNVKARTGVERLLTRTTGISFAPHESIPRQEPS